MFNYTIEEKLRKIKKFFRLAISIDKSFLKEYTRFANILFYMADWVKRKALP